MDKIQQKLFKTRQKPCYQRTTPAMGENWAGVVCATRLTRFLAPAEKKWVFFVLYELYLELISK
jgi:hypothetical protein